MDQEALIIEKTEDTPSVNLDPSSGVFYIKGRSLPENPFQFYKEVIGWLSGYLSSPTENTLKLTINLDYFNSSSGRYLLEIFSILEKASEDGHNIEIVWEVDKEDELMIEKGEEYGELLHIPVHLKQV